MLKRISTCYKFTFTTFNMDTKSNKPVLFFGSRHGSIYNLTPTNLPKDLTGVQLSVGDFYDNKDVLKNLPQGMTFKKFLGFDETVQTYLTAYDFYKEEPITGCQNSKQVKIKCVNGYNAINAQQYDQIAEIVKPDILVTLTQYPALGKDYKKNIQRNNNTSKKTKASNLDLTTTKNQQNNNEKPSQNGNVHSVQEQQMQKQEAKKDSNKSYKRAINKTTTYLEHSKLWKQKEKIGLRFAALHGARNLALLSRSMEQVLQHDIDGFVVCDLCLEETFEQRETIFKHIQQRLKHQQKQIILCLAGLGKISDIQHARKFGYTHFEVNYPFFLAQKKLALIKNDNQYLQKSPVKHENLDPLDKNCTCQTCTRHSESYIAHLIECYEMTANVLLTIHNMHVYTEYMKQFD